MTELTFINQYHIVPTFQTWLDTLNVAALIFSCCDCVNKLQLY